MPALLEVQHALYRSLVERDDTGAAGHVVADGLTPAARLNIYRNTFAATLTTALRLSFPAVRLLVGAEFFEGAARIFMEAAPPTSAYLDEYGAEFPAFLERFPPAAALAYLADVARLEWAVSHALHAPDAAALDIAGLSAVAPADHGSVAFVPHPSLGLIEAAYPADAIWRAVLAEDEVAMAAVDLGAGPVRLLVQRLDAGVDVTGLDEPAWRFLAALCGGMPLGEAIASAPDLDAAAALAEHLAHGCFTSFVIPERSAGVHSKEMSA